MPMVVFANCSQEESIQSEAVVDYLNSWTNAHLAYTQYAKCNNGIFGEGFSEAAIRLFVNDWPELNHFMEIANKDKAFKKYVIEHINATLNQEDLEQVKDLASNKCPKTVELFCKEVVIESGKAISEIQINKKQ